MESFPQDTQGVKTSASFLYNGTRTLFEKAGFEYQRPLGKTKCLVTKEVAAA